jgi:2'-5' RNA ligase
MDSTGFRGDFHDVERLRNHWAQPLGTLGYYWFLTFEHSSALHAVVRECQTELDFSYYDLVPLAGLHLTLDRIAPEGAISSERLELIQATAVRARHEVAPFDIKVTQLGGTRGAIGFDVESAELYRLRETIRTTTASAYPDMTVNTRPFHPHISIAYANTEDAPAADAVAAVERMNEAIGDVEVTDAEVVLVLLRRQQGAYAWDVVGRTGAGRF